ncbi:MAG: nitroreductase family protein [Thermomicrobiales bacterium]
MDTPDIIEFLRSLRSVRRFTAQPVPQDAVDDLLTVARWSGSAKNVQPWEFIVVRDPETLRQLGALPGYVTHLANAPLAIALVMDGDANAVQQETFDEGILSQRIQLAAQAHGLGSSIGWFHGEGRSKAKELLGVPQDRLLRTALSVGYEDTSGDGGRFHPDQARKPLAELVHQERWGQR